MKIPRIQSVEPLNEKRLVVTFVNGVQKIYDCQEILRLDRFQPLTNDALFKSVQVDVGGYGISWDDEIDLSEFELWTRGIQVAPNEIGIFSQTCGETK